MERKMKIKQKAIGLVFTFLLTLLLLVLFVSLDLYFGVFHEKSIIRKINESNYYHEVYKELNTEAESLVNQAGLPTSVLAEVITLERVYISGEKYVESTLRGQTSEIATDKLREDFIHGVNEYLVSENILQNKELTAGVEGLATDIEQIYLQGIQLEFIHYITNYRQKYLSAIRWVIPIIILCISVICYFLIKMHSYKHRGVRQIDYAVNASSILAVGVAAYLLLTKRYEQPEITPEYYRNLLSLLLQWNYQVLLYLGGIGAALSMILITLVGYMRNRLNG